MLIIATIGLILLIWFRSDAWLEYCRLFRLDCLSFYKDYEVKKYNDVTLTYRTYLLRHHNCFFVRMITCPICLAVWLGIVACLLKCIIPFMAFKAGLTGFLILLTTVGGIFAGLPILVLGGLVIYALIDRWLG